MNTTEITIAVRAEQLRQRLAAIRATGRDPETGEQRRYCGTCGEREGSSYSNSCCTDDAMIEG